MVRVSPEVGVSFAEQTWNGGAAQWRVRDELSLLGTLVACRDGQCPEYSGEEQAICAVGLVKAKPGVFIEAIQHLIVLATPVEVRPA